MSTSDFACGPGQGPPMNTDVSGIGVRISFYLQTLLLACLAVRSSRLKEAKGAMFTLVATNMALVATVLILGLKTSPEITLHDGLIVVYLLCFSTACVFFSVPSQEQPFHFLNSLSIIQTYLFFAFIFTLLIRAKNFGSSPGCNGNAIVVIFRPFPLLHAGQIVGWVLACLIIIFYTWVTIKDHIPRTLRQEITPMGIWKIRVPVIRTSLPMERTNVEGNVETSQGVNPAYFQASLQISPIKDSLNIDWGMLLRIMAVVVLWVVGVINTELLIKWSRFQHDDDSRSIWTFGQILPLFLVMVPLVEVIDTFKKYGLRPSEE